MRVQTIYVQMHFSTRTPRKSATVAAPVGLGFVFQLTLETENAQFCFLL